MLFTITTWIIVLTVAGIVAVCVFRAICEPEVDLEKKYATRAKRASETNHYEPLNHELKKIEAEEAGTAEKKESEEPVKEKEALLVDVKTEENKVESAVSEEKKPLNTQAVDNPDALQEVVTTNAVVEPSNNAPAVQTVVIETQQSSQTLVSSTVSTVSEVNVQKSAEISPPQPPIVKVNNVTATVADPIPEQPAALLETPQAPPNPPAIDVVAPEQPGNNEIPTPYNEVESATLPRLNGPTETTAVKAAVLPA